MSEQKNSNNDEMTVYVPKDGLPQPSYPLKQSTDIKTLEKYIGKNEAEDVKARKAYVLNTWTGRIYKNDTQYILLTDTEKFLADQS